MANTLTTNPLIINAEGVISEKPIWIRMVRVLPATIGDFITFTYWDEEGTPDHQFYTQSVVVSTLDFTNGSFVAGAPAENDIVYFYKTSTGNNKFRFQTATAGNDTKFVADALNSHMGSVTDETMVACCKIWTPKVAFDFDTTVTPSIRPLTINFGEKGKRFPNLAVHTIDTNLTAEIFVR